MTIQEITEQCHGDCDNCDIAEECEKARGKHGKIN